MPAPPVDLVVERPLSRRVRCGQPVAAPVLVDARAADHREDRVAVAERVGQSAQHHRANPLAGHVAVGRRREGLAATVGRQHPALQNDTYLYGTEVEADPTDDRAVDLAGEDGLARQVQHHQRRRACRVGDEARPMQVQEIRHPIGNDREGVPADEARRDVRAGLDDVLRVFPAPTCRHTRPVRIRDNPGPTCPARSSASYATSMNCRCCGSSTAASAGDTWKNRASKACTSGI
jgi:hypothetical protein